METLNRREEEALVKATKARAMKECDGLVQGVVVLTISKTI